jgi:hypothetical protein
MFHSDVAGEFPLEFINEWAEGKLAGLDETSQIVEIRLHIGELLIQV